MQENQACELYSNKENNGGNMIIHDGILDALKTLPFKHEGQVECIYIEFETGCEKAYLC